MTRPLYHDLQAAPGVRPRSTPWRVADDGTVLAADGEVVCVLGHPENDLTEEDVVHGALILAAPMMLEILKAVLPLVASPTIRPIFVTSAPLLSASIKRVVALAEGRP